MQGGTLAALRLTALIALGVPSAHGGNQSGSVPDARRHGETTPSFDRHSAAQHFQLLADGGTIELSLADAADFANRDVIRRELARIARDLAAGKFDSSPFVESDRAEPVATLKRLGSAVSYKFVSTETGGQIRIATHDAEVLKAVHDFLSFQIKSLRTGDNPAISKQLPFRPMPIEKAREEP